MGRGLLVVRRLYLGEVTVVLDGWEHWRTVLRVESQAVAVDGTTVRHEDRYFISSLPVARLSPDPWRLVVRRQWGIETAHPILEVALADAPTSTNRPGPQRR